MLLRNPDDDMMAKNLRFYLAKVDDSAPMPDLEQARFANDYLEALRTYALENYTATVAHMERSLRLYQYEYEECRAFCEGDYEQGWQPDFVTATASTDDNDDDDRRGFCWIAN